MPEKILEFFVTLLFLIATPGALGPLYGALCGLFSFVVFIVIYLFSWRMSRISVLGVWTRGVARWILRIQALLFSFSVAGAVGASGHDKQWGTQVIVAAVLAILVLPSLAQEVFIRRLRIRNENKADRETLFPAAPTRLQRIFNFFETMATELDGIRKVVTRDGNLRFVRTILALLVSFAFCCVLIVPWFAAASVAGKSGDDSHANSGPAFEDQAIPDDVEYALLGYDDGADAALITFWTLIAASVAAAFLFDLWFKRRLRRRRVAKQTNGRDVRHASPHS